MAESFVSAVGHSSEGHTKQQRLEIIKTYITVVIFSSGLCDKKEISHNPVSWMFSPTFINTFELNCFIFRLSLLIYTKNTNKEF